MIILNLTKREKRKITTVAAMEVGETGIMRQGHHKGCLIYKVSSVAGVHEIVVCLSNPYSVWSTGVENNHTEVELVNIELQILEKDD